MSVRSSVLAAALATMAMAQDLTTEQVASMGNNSLFTTWRPTSHFIAPAGWQNDPCGFMYDPVRAEYHGFYQWSPEHINWGNVSWGHGVSKDLITWTDVTGWQGYEAVALGPQDNNKTYDGLGIFSGTAQPVNLNGEQDGNLTIFYTAVQYLPTSWNIPYIKGTEKQALATSSDGGVTWQQYEMNPIIISPPDGWNVTGWRDPFFEPSPLLDAVIGQTEPHYYAVFGSGIKGVGPRIPLYSAPACDLTNWTFLGSLWEPVANSSFGDLFATGTNGFNYEVSGFFSLTDDEGHEHWYANMGTEGGNVTFHESPHWSLHYEGVISRRANGSVALTPIAGGPTDYGNLYAISSFNDTKNNRRLMIGWAEEDIVADSGSFSAHQQGFQGSLSLPRELFVQIKKGIVNNDGTLLELGPSYIEEESDGTFSARSLGMKVPEDILLGLRNGSTQHTFQPGNYTQTTPLLSNGSSHFELSATMTNITGRAGFRIAQSPDASEHTTIWFDPSNYTVAVDRSSSSQIVGFNNATVWGYFRPYYHASSRGPESEPLHWHIFQDGSLVEILINHRFAITTRIYPGQAAANGIGLFLDNGASAVYEDVAVWADLYNVWPERPLNSSSPLRWDSPEQTNNYTWWTGD